MSRDFVLRSLALGLVAFALAGCPRQPSAVEVPEREPLEGWRVGAAEHLALWYHGLAYTRAGAARDTVVLPPYRPGYVDSIVAVKRARGVYPTELDRRADEFAERFRDGGYDGLQFVPLYFRNMEALFAGIALWRRAGGDPRRTGSADAARVVAFLSTLFPRGEQREVVAEFAGVLREEADTFYHAYWQELGPDLVRRAAAVQTEWDRLAPRLRTYLDYLQLEDGELFLVPALDGEGRTVTRGTTSPRVAVPAPPDGRPREAVLAFVHELLYPLVGDVIRDYLAPVRIREVGEDVLAARAAARGGALLLDRAAPDRAADYRRFYLRAAGRTPPEDPASLEAAFADAFPIPSELERGLVEVIERALAGI
ncbi:MAG TPA: hypothetical protein VF188_14970 [Longimicrobiales bacterium]